MGAKSELCRVGREGIILADLSWAISRAIEYKFTASRL
jgi:hypothetical protein